MTENHEHEKNECGEAILRTIIDSLPFDMFALDTRGTYIMQNKVCRSSWGDVIGKHPEDFMKDANTLELWRTNNARAMRGERVDGEVRFDVNGVPKIFYNIIRPVILEEKLLGIVGINLDMTEIRKKELELYELTEKLRVSEEKYRLITENASDLIQIIDDHGIIEYVNEDAHERTLGYTKHDLIGKDFRDFVYSDDPRDAVIKLLESNLSGITHVELRVKHRDSDEVTWLDVTVTSIPAVGGKLKHIIIARNITSRKKYELLLAEENVRLRRLDGIQRNFVALAAHELKTPLTAVYSVSKYLIDELPGGTPESVRDLVSVIFKGSCRLKDLVEKLLDVNYLDEDVFIIEKKKSDFIQITRNVLERLKRVIDQRQLHVTLTGPESVSLLLDDIRMAQVLVNLFSNAIKNTSIGGHIEVIVKELDKEIDVAIIDDGIGILPEDLAHLFKKFGKLPDYEGLYSAPDIQGPGLGLYISNQIVEKHGGKMRVESRGRGEGASFMFRIPKE